MELLDNLTEIWKFKNIVISNISIVELMKEYGIKLESKSTGQFSHRTFCPFHKGKNGNTERTPSMFVSEQTNSFCCFGCLEENTLIWTDSGLKQISDVKIGDIILSHNGEKHKVINKINKISEKTNLISIGSFNNIPIVMSPEHICLVIDKDNIIKSGCVKPRKDTKIGLRFLKSKSKLISDIYIKQKESEFVKPFDFFCFPVIKSEYRNNSYLFNNHILNPYKKGKVQKRIEYLPVNLETAWLYGIWLAEGSTSCRQVRFTFNINEEKKFAKMVVKILKKYFNLRSKIYLYKDKNTCEVICCKDDLKKQFEFWFGKYSYGKKIPFECLFWTPEIQKMFIKGYLDGYHSVENNVITVSNKLAFGMYAIGIQCGYYPSVSFRNSYIDNKNINHRESYVITFKKKESLRGFFTEINNVEYFLSVVKSNNVENKSVNVVDITTDVENTFTTFLGSVHNCGHGGSVIDFVQLMDGSPPAVALTKLAKQLGLIDKDGKWDELKIDALGGIPEMEPIKSIEPFLFEISSLLRNYIKLFINTPKFEEEFKWMEKVSKRVDEFLLTIGHEDWEYVKDLCESVQRSIKTRIRKKG
ncbi:MAG: CHC2 zinc finger domain-containing protein [Patescibacteria group bacterium]|jgi:hypothetical protein